ncbi:MAG: 23S rRNA (pseudouridine(1915)-N(3))-methyltransferase RlmH [Candidatus Eremiobacteraeota bacterium]|nr:23S rRNA (pseudouridine(1915)-N(3))-methyltransferase RlmH [Candidatus Eremiobacteraeota bacterium]
MNLRLIYVGKTRTQYVAQACAEFGKRIAPYFPLEEIEIRASDGSDPAGAMREEADRIARHLRPDDAVWLLERTGTELSSPDLSRKLDAFATSGATRLTFVICGTYGADASVLARATFRWSLSQLTFLHEWARMFVLEQLYRAAKIARNEPYHH